MEDFLGIPGEKSMRSRRSIWTGTLALVAIALFTVSAQAGVIESLMFLDGDTTNVASDESVEYLVKGSGNTTAGVIEVGDIFRGAININTLNSNSANVGGATSIEQWTAVFSIKVLDLYDRGYDNSGIEQYYITFGVDTTFQTWLDGIEENASDPTLGTGTMIRLYTNGTHTADFDGSATADTNIATAATGEFYWDLGYAAASGQTSITHSGSGSLSATVAEGWVAVGGIGVAGASSTVSFGDSNFLLNVLQYGSGVEVVAHDVSVPSVYGLSGASTWQSDISGSVNVRGAGAYASNGFDLSNNAQFDFLAVPVPAATWPGLMMLFGLGAVRFRRRLLAS
jgi:hypothetical protein